MHEPIAVQLKASPDTVTGMLTSEHFKEQCQRRSTEWIAWNKDGPTHAVGKVPYLRSKKLSGVRFHVNLEAAEGGSHGTVTVEPTAFFRISRWIIYALGLLIACVGILFTEFGLSLLGKRVAEMQAEIAITLSHATGFLIACAGALFSVIGVGMLDKRVAEMQADIANALSHAASA